MQEAICFAQSTAQETQGHPLREAPALNKPPCPHPAMKPSLTGPQGAWLPCYGPSTSMGSVKEGKSKPPPRPRHGALLAAPAAFSGL